MLQMLLEHPQFEQTDVGHLRQVCYGASPMPRPVIERAISIWGQDRFWQYYGQTECPMAIAVLRPEDHHGDTLSACGRPALDVEIKLVNERGDEVEQGEPGEIVLRASSQMVGYFNAPELNSDMYLEGGWLRTRDVASFDKKGYLHIKDRTSDMIITGGYNVYPKEIEDALMQHPAVFECAVVGKSHPKWVEEITAAIVLRKNDSLDAQAIIDFLRDKLASYKLPRSVLFVDEVPKTAIGKINRKSLRDQVNSE